MVRTRNYPVKIVGASFTLEVEFTLSGTYSPERAANLTFWPGDPPEGEDIDYRLTAIALLEQRWQTTEGKAKRMEVRTEILDRLLKYVPGDVLHEIFLGTPYAQEQAAEAMRTEASE